MRRRRSENPSHLWHGSWVFICESDESEKMREKTPRPLNLSLAKRVITRERQREIGNKVNDQTIYLINITAARRTRNDGGAKARTIDPLTGRIVDARPRFAAHREKGRNLSRVDRHYIDSGTLAPNPGGRQRVRATFAKQPKDSIARSNTMRREIINQALMYSIVSLFVFLMIPLLRLVS